MKEFFKGILVFCGASIVSLIFFWFLFLYSFGYSIWLSVTLKKWYACFQFLWRMIDGTFATIGYLLYQIGYSQDLLWNVYGEAIEDATTAKEDTNFSQKNITVSASIGKLEIDNKLNKSGRVISEILNIAFWQKQHAKDSWLFLKAKEELKENYFKKKVG